MTAAVLTEANPTLNLSELPDARDVAESVTVRRQLFARASGTIVALEMERFSIHDRKGCAAIVIRKPQDLPGRVGQLVAENRGLRVRVFSERRPAVAWIESART